MKITKNALRQIIREEVAKLQDPIESSQINEQDQSQMKPQELKKYIDQVSGVADDNTKYIDGNMQRINKLVQRVKQLEQKMLEDAAKK